MLEYRAKFQTARLAVRARVPLNPADNHILTHLSQNGPSTTTSIFTPPLPCTTKTIYNAIAKLTKLGLIQRVDTGYQGVPATYDLVD